MVSTQIQETQLDKIERATLLATIATKNVLVFDEVAVYMGVSKSHLYKLTSASLIPHYKPRGKMLYFDREELEKWLLQNRVATTDEIEERATAYTAKGIKGGVKNV